MEAFLRFLRGEFAHLKSLYILGDLFEFWIGGAHIGLPDFQAVLQLFREITRSGVEVCFVHGNRDFHVDGSFQRRTGVKVLGEQAAIELGGRRALLLHGDSLCTADVHYHSYRRFARSLAGRSFFRAMPLPLKTIVAKCMTLASSYTGSARNGGQHSLSKSELMGFFKNGYELVICGHVHQPGERRWVLNGRECVLYVLGSWDEKGMYLEFDGKEFRLKNALEGTP